MIDTVTVLANHQWTKRNHLSQTFTPTQTLTPSLSYSADLLKNYLTDQGTQKSRISLRGRGGGGEGGYPCM